MENLRKWRESKHFSQKEVAISLGVAPPQISKWEAGVTEPSLENLIKLSDLYGITLDEIVGRAQSLDTLTSQERKMISLYHALNPDGRAKLMEQAELLAGSEKYRQEKASAI